MLSKSPLSQGRYLWPWIVCMLAIGLGATVALAAGEGTFISLDGENIGLNDVLQILAERSGLNIVTDQAVAGRTISIHLRDTPFDEALNLVVRAAGLGYERFGSSILVAEVERLKTQTGLVTRVFDLQYANAADVRQLLGVVSGNVTASATGNRIAIRATESEIEEAAGLIAAIDRKPQQILLEARLVEVNTTRMQELGIDWEKITKWTSILGEGPLNPSAPGKMPAELGYLKIDETADYYRQVNAIEVAIDALLTDGAARLLANTQVVTLDNQAAEIFAGETVPVVITSLSSPGGAGGVLQTVQLEKIDVGVRLNILPRVSEGGYITVRVEPEVSRIVAFVGPGDDLPQTSSRRANTLVRVRDGEKIFLGGLLTQEKRETVKKVPLLGQIPLLGYFFQHRRTDEVRLDLLIEITPRLVGDAGSARPQAMVPEVPPPDASEASPAPGTSEQ
jgi:type II secretory pathway component GspD/PulD (secretin)